MLVIRILGFALIFAACADAVPEGIDSSTDGTDAAADTARDVTGVDSDVRDAATAGDVGDSIEDAQAHVDAAPDGVGAPDTRPPEPCLPSAPVLVGEAPNARDLGGLPLSGGTTECGAVYRGGPLSGLGAAGCDELARLGVRTVIDLRQPTERVSVPAAACVADIAATVTAPMPIPYSLDAPAYLADLDATDAIRAAFDALGDPAAYPIYFHCTYGRDRTGVLAAVILVALGASPETVMADYMISRDNGVGAFPTALTAVLEALAERGGAEAWLRSIGVSDAQLATLRARLARP